MTRQVGGELTSVGQHLIEFAVKALHQLLSPLLEFSITAAAVAEIADGEAVDELATRIEPGEKVSPDVMKVHDNMRQVARGASRSHACNSRGAW